MKSSDELGKWDTFYTVDLIITSHTPQTFETRLAASAHWVNILTYAYAKSTPRREVGAVPDTAWGHVGGRALEHVRVAESWGLGSAPGS